jgi:hypothetical protein
VSGELGGVSFGELERYMLEKPECGWYGGGIRGEGSGQSKTRESRRGERLGTRDMGRGRSKRQMGGEAWESERGEDQDRGGGQVLGSNGRRRGIVRRADRGLEFRLKRKKRWYSRV